MIFKRLLLTIIAYILSLPTFNFFDFPNIEKNSVINEDRNINNAEHAIIDGGVYFIKPYLNTNKSLDVPNLDYSVGTKEIIYDSLGWNNQRFVLEQSFGNYYRIRPIDACELYLGIDYSNSSSHYFKLYKNVNYGDDRL